jgi:hypothetical protein
MTILLEGDGLKLLRKLQKGVFDFNFVLTKRGAGSVHCSEGRGQLLYFELMTLANPLYYAGSQVAFSVEVDFPLSCPELDSLFLL